MILQCRASRLVSCLALPLMLAVSGCGSLKSITINPSSGSVVLNAVGQTAQFTALGASQTGNASPTTSNITDSVTWSVSNPNVATINASGVATAVGAGYTQIMVQSDGITATSDLTVNISSSSPGTTAGGVASISIIPGSQAVASPNQTSQFIAIGTTSTGATVNLTNQVVWSSSSTQIATIGTTTGLASAVGQGSATITALYSNLTGGTVVAGTATFTVAGGTTEKFTAVTITPGSQSLSASGQTGQLIALGTLGSTGLKTDVTSLPQLQWSSSSPSIASVSASGLVTGLSVGASTITAELSNTDGSVVSSTAAVAITATAAPEPLLSLTIIPSSITLGNLQGTGQFLAIGTYSTAPYVRDLTNSPSLVWISDQPSVFPVDTNAGGNSGATAGIVTAYGAGSATIIAEATSSDGSIQTATSILNCPQALPNPTGNPPTLGTCVPGTQASTLLSTLTVYNEGLNTTNWLLTAASATGTLNVIHCGPGSTSGGSVCTATYPIGTQVLITAPATGAAFGGWSSNCRPVTISVPPTTGPNTCTVNLTYDDSVGAIFN